MLIDKKFGGKIMYEKYVKSERSNKLLYNYKIGDCRSVLYRNRV